MIHRIALLLTVSAAACSLSDPGQSAWSLSNTSSQCGPSTCELAFQTFMASGSGGGDATAFRSVSAGSDFDDDLAFCYRVGEMEYDETFNCRDFSFWFQKCMEARGHDKVTQGLRLGCGGCDDGDEHLHQAVLYQRPDGLWCPGEPQSESNGEADECCKPKRSQAGECATKKWCDGTWPNRAEPRAGREGCVPNNDLLLYYDSAYACRETCTKGQREMVCKLLELPPEY